jgi:DNA-binding transcriptional regulator YiaG
MRQEIGKPRPAGVGGRRLASYEATALVGLRVHVANAVIEHVDEAGEVFIEIPRLDELSAAAAVARCLRALRLRGWELRAIRKIMGLTLAEMAGKLGEKTAPETVSRWESEKQPMGGYVEKCIRLVVCEALKEKARGIKYDGSMIADLTVMDPWIMTPNYEVPYLLFSLEKVREQSGDIVDTYSLPKAA